MSRVLGIDYSTKAVDLVFLGEDVDVFRWHSIPLERGIDGLRQIRQAYTWGRELEDVYLVAIEDAYSAGRAQAKKLGRVCGAIIASLPSDVAVWLMRPDEWRMACGLPGNAPKKDVAQWALERFGPNQVGMWAQDAVDALAMAYAAREINAKAIEAA